ncbi:MAG: methylenetetrahydrofolate reductase [NAD(P)H] [Arenicellales bacterium]
MSQDIKKTFSLEYFPARTEKGEQSLAAARIELSKLKPAFVSVTFGAGGSTQDGTYQTIKSIIQEDGIDAAPHISCISTSREALKAMLDDYRDIGVRRLVVLRGDMPSGFGAAEHNELRYANELVEFIRQQTSDYFTIEVAAYPETHPQAGNAFDDLENFKRKVEAGANSAITQYFFNPDAYFQFVDDCLHRGVSIPITPGIMPITNHKQLARFSDACGAEIPRWIRKRLEAYGDDLESIRKFGLDVVTHLCEQLLAGGAPGLHFYSMNRAEPVKTIWNDLNLSG